MAERHQRRGPKARPKTTGSARAPIVLPFTVHQSIRRNSRSVDYVALFSTESTERQLNVPKISHFDQLGCNSIGRNTARNNSAVKSCSNEPLNRAGVRLVIALLQPSEKSGL